MARRVWAPVCVLALLGCLGLSCAREATAQTRSRGDERQSMVERQIRARGVASPDVLAALLAVPRHLFVPAAERTNAYQDRPLPIGYGQTISQPYIVAYMTELLDLVRADRVLEIGTGSGYQAAVLAQIVDEVYSIEIIPELAAAAGATLRTAGYPGVRLRAADGYWGWSEVAPFDAIIVTAAADHVPPALLAQLAPGGRMVIPVGAAWEVQALLLLTKDQDGRVERRHTLDVRFVPFTRASTR